MKGKIVLTLIIAISIVSTAAATTISQEDITIDLATSEVDVDMHVQDLTTESFNWRTTHSVRNLEATFGGEEKSCKVQDLTVGAEINCDTDLRKDFTVNLSYSTSGIVSSQNGIKTFSYSQSIYRPIRNYSMTVVLPEGTGLVDQSNITAPVVQPEGGELGNMDGRRFSVKWETNPELGETARFQVIYENLEENPLENILPPLVGALIIIGIAYTVYRRKSEVETSSIIEELGNDEKMVLEMLRENEGEMLQKDIVEDSEYSKAKISGVVGGLEEKEIVSKEKDGRSNKVELKEKFN